jgi:hypothetical protein
MTHISQINYSDAFQGKIRRRPSPNPLAAWFVAQGAVYRGSNEFVDSELVLTEDHFENVLRIIQSARKQGHDGVEIRLTAESLAAIQSRIAELSALEDVDIESQFYGEHLRREKAIIVFRERKSDGLLERARNNLSADEYAELKQLIDARLTRSEREVLLTVKAITASQR